MTTTTTTTATSTSKIAGILAAALLAAAGCGGGSGGKKDGGAGGAPADAAQEHAAGDAHPDAGADSGADVAVDSGSGPDAADGPAAGDGAVDAPPEMFQVTLLQTNDLHSYLQGHDPELDYSPATTGDDSTMGGISRLAARVAAARAAAGGAPVMLLDSGDFMMGTAFEFIATTQAAELGEMQRLGYDAITLGNHEFDWTPGGLALILGAATSKGLTVPIVASNLQLDPASTDTGAQAVRQLVQRKLVKTLSNGLKVGVFGLLGKNAVDVTPTVKPFTFQPIADAAAALVSELRTQDHVDLVVALSHSGINQAGVGEDADLAAAVPGIDVILSGHTHDQLDTAVVKNGTIITQTGRYGEHLGKLALTVTRTSSGSSAALDSYTLIPIDDSVAGDSPTQGRVDGYENQITQLIAPLAYDQPLAKTGFDVPAGGGETAIGDLVTDSYRTVVSALAPGAPAAIAIDAAGAIRARIAKGKTGSVVFADAFRVLPLGIGPDQHPGYPLVAFYLNGSDLRSGLELSAAGDVVGADYVLQASGLTATYDPAQPPFQRVTTIKVGGAAVGLGDTATCFKVTTTLYVAGLLGVVQQASHGTRQVVPKEADCSTVVTDMNAHIVRTGSAAGAPELKAWQALVTFLTGLPPDGGVPAIPSAYMAPQGRIAAQ